MIDRERAQQQGVNPQVVAGVVGYALRGQELSRYRTGGKEIPVRVRFQEEDRETLRQLKELLRPRRRDGRLRPPLRGDRRELPGRLAAHLARGQADHPHHHPRARGGRGGRGPRHASSRSRTSIDLPEGVRFGDRRDTSSADEDLAALQFAACLSVVFIYLLMGFLFESFILPLSIICTIPLAGIGVGWIHFALGYNLDFLGVVGIVLLIGVVVNNGIVLIDYVNRLRGRGHGAAARRC